MHLHIYLYIYLYIFHYVFLLIICLILLIWFNCFFVWKHFRLKVAALLKLQEGSFRDVCFIPASYVRYNLHILSTCSHTSTKVLLVAMMVYLSVKNLHSCLTQEYHIIHSGHSTSTQVKKEKTNSKGKDRKDHEIRVQSLFTWKEMIAHMQVTRAFGLTGLCYSWFIMLFKYVLFVPWKQTFIIKNSLL